MSVGRSVAQEVSAALTVVTHFDRKLTVGLTASFVERARQRRMMGFQLYGQAADLHGRQKGMAAFCITCGRVGRAWGQSCRAVEKFPANILRSIMNPITRVIAMTEAHLIFATQREWENWLAQNEGTSTGAWLRFAKKGGGLLTLTYAQAVESALCYGWIDGQKRAGSDEYWLQRFTRRSAKSIWSQLNKDKAEALIAGGRMRPPGMREIEKARNDGRWEMAYTSASNSTVPDDLQVALDANPEAGAFFATLNSRNRYAILFRIQNAKKPETRARKIEEFVGMLNRGETIHP